MSFVAPTGVDAGALLNAVISLIAGGSSAAIAVTWIKERGKNHRQAAQYRQEKDMFKLRAHERRRVRPGMKKRKGKRPG